MNIIDAVTDFYKLKYFFLSIKQKFISFQFQNCDDFGFVHSGSC